MKTYMAKPDSINRKWYVVDADGKRSGRLASEIASVLRGKHKPEFTPHLDTGDYVIVINAEKVALTGNKENQKLYRRHTGYTGNLKTICYKDMMEKHPERIVEIAVKGMVAHNKLGRQVLAKLHVYAGSEHPHQAQKPEVLEIKG
ncbi:50S ribosomal protein L13 [endosymbiont 'TC1' of Trimyema compressum]|uniref:50S ribosomal protein L13 n=1 Tax=endosymbiont 'TC1' of Trimyema compressum TaxID=243899 RepID=UPI0007F186ED|nr:50S ribosomal protein L13 [endosymbiont 'TC1' of Trimyema compressum]AMP21188.1 50S ribosomal protein L13 [endosymbiont 'TC1' of Trimyema compressum]